MNDIEKEEAQSATPMILASTGQRFMTFLLDSIFIFVFGFIFALAIALFGSPDTIKNMNKLVFGIALTLIYYVPQEAFWGRTLGKLIAGTKAVSENGAALVSTQALLRTICRHIPFDALSFFGGGGRPSGWHDRIARSKVISIKGTA
jgi:uncharacterized RDD family membrane protein YckC